MRIVVDTDARSNMAESYYPGGYFSAVVNNDFGRYNWKLVPFLLIWLVFVVLIGVSL